MQRKGLHVAPMKHGIIVLLIPFLTFIAHAVRPETQTPPPEHLTLNLAASGHAQFAGHHKHHKHHKQESIAQVKPAVATELSQLAATSTQQKAGTGRQQMLACSKMAELVRRYSQSGLVQFFAPTKAEIFGSEPPTNAALKEGEVKLHGQEYVPEKSCESAADVLRNLISQERHVEVVFMLGSVVATVVAIICLSIFVGMGLKPSPPAYWKNKSRCWCSFDNAFDEEVDVTDELLPAVQKLFDMTTIPEKMGVGRDGDWQTHKHFKVTRVVRIEHGRNWTAYALMKKYTPSFFQTCKTMPAELRKATEESWRSIRTIFDSREADPVVGPFLRKLGLDSARNEVLLFHGSPLAGGRNRKGDVIFDSAEHAPMNAIKRTGFDERLGNVKGMLGSGTYFGDHVSKADCYAGRYNEWKEGADPGSVGESAALFLSRVVLGTPYVTNQSMEQLRRPPCTQGHFDFQLDFSDVQFGTPWNKKGFDLQVCDHERCNSIISDMVIDGDQKNWREYVVYEKRGYPEFLVYYDRLE